MQNQKKAGEQLPWTILKVLQWAAPYFESLNIENPRASAEILLAHVLNVQRIDLYVQYDKPLFSQELHQFKALIQRRIRHEPVAYIVGRKGFWSLDLKVTPDVLIPRPETECLVETALPLLPEFSKTNPKKILDLGTGSGAIILSLASERPGHMFFAADRSFKALAVAQENARRNNLDVQFFAADWFAPLKKGIFFDLIVSNPPYIKTNIISDLQPEIVKYEPYTALDGGEDGLKDLRYIIENAPQFLADDGHLILEIGCDQGDAVQEIGRSTGFYKKIACIKDYAGLDRTAVFGR